MKRLVCVACLLCAAGPVAAQGAGQARPNRQAQQGRGLAAGDPSVTPAEIQRMFDAYALVQAQDQLQLTDEQYARFLARYKMLQDIRRKALDERTRAIAELRRLLAPAARPADESEIKGRLQILSGIETRAIADVGKAHDGVDEVLDTRQQGLFRVFEEQMERRKLELVTRARQVNRQNQQNLQQ
jgi:hypothetical protein